MSFQTPLTLKAFRTQTPDPTSLRTFYKSLHARAAATTSLFISLTPLPTLLSAIEALETIDPTKSLPLHAVPYLAKDNFDAPPHPTTAACPAYSYLPTHPAPTIEALNAAGAILLGKLNMDQFATGLVGTRTPHGTPINPYNPHYIPGGSSSASAVALAKALAVFSLATDTAGSGRVPAAMNALVGLKPTKGLVSTTGVVPAAASLDCVSVFASNVADARLVYKLLSAISDPRNPFSRWPPKHDAEVSGRPLRFGVPEGPALVFHGDSVSERCYRGAERRLSELSMVAVAVEFDVFRDAASLLYGGPFVAERFAGVGQFIKDNFQKHRSAFDPIVAGIILEAEKPPAWKLFEAQAEMKRLVMVAEETVWNKVDFLLLPTVPRPVTLEEVEKEPVKINSMLGTYTNFVNLMDYCAIALPAPGVEGIDVPRGVTLVAKAFDEDMLLDIAQQFEVPREEIMCLRK